MISRELLNKIRLIEIQTRRILSGALIGNRRSIQKGYGLNFDQIREYQLGDDVRFIDWKSSARSNKILVKEYKEERIRTIMLMLDISSSSFFGSQNDPKFTVMTHIASILAFVADNAQDKVGLILFAENIESYIPPKTGIKHVYAILQKILLISSQRKKTNIQKALEYMASLKRKDTIVFLISDFIDNGYDKYLKIVARMYDLVAIRILDSVERQFPAVGLLQLHDLEAGTSTNIQVVDKGLDINRVLAERIASQDLWFHQYNIRRFDVLCNKNYIDDLILFLQRLHY